MNIRIPQCYKCKHYNADTGLCKAFRDKRIPTQIKVNKHDHRFPYPFDNGIQFEPVGDYPEQASFVFEVTPGAASAS